MPIVVRPKSKFTSLTQWLNPMWDLDDTSIKIVDD